jgi:hypothetical protein
LLQEVWTLEVFRDRIVQPWNHLIDGFFPRLLRIFAGLNCFEELLERLLDNIPEVRRYLKLITLFISNVWSLATGSVIIATFIAYTWKAI